jgi:hypothetical protein
MFYQSFTFPVISLLGIILFQLGNSHAGLSKPFPQKESAASIVLPPTIQVLLYGGERYLAGNIESIRALHAFGNNRNDEQEFRVRSHIAASTLHPCHEDNYWIGNANLSWGGNAPAGFELLLNARNCRFWDEWPAFFYGFNQYFFNQNTGEALDSLSLAAERAIDEQNIVFYKTFAITLKSTIQKNIQLALQLLKAERDQATDHRLRSSIETRIQRVEGLLVLRNAQEEFESHFNKELKNEQELISSGFLERMPVDPLGLGYEFRDQTFHLRQLRIE